MTYWRYRAYDETLRIQEGVITDPHDDVDEAIHSICLKLRQQNFQMTEIKTITHDAYIREEKLNHLKRRVGQRPQHNAKPKAPNKSHLSIRDRLKLLWTAIIGR